MKSEMLSFILLCLLFAMQGKGEQCPLGTYGVTCGKNCSSHCAPSSSDKAVYCDKLTGGCSEGCNRGWHGDQCYFRCSRNCLNNVCEVERGTCVQCKANYSGEYCETYEGSYSKKYENQTAQDKTSTPVDAKLIPAFVVVVVILIIIIIIILIVYIHRRRSQNRKQATNQSSGVTDGQNQMLLADNEVNRIHNQDTDLIVACRQGNLPRIRHILDKSLGDINKHGSGGITPVMWAVRRGYREIVELLDTHGADFKLTDDVCNNILHWACYGEHVAMVRYVVSKNEIDPTLKGLHGRTPLMYVARHGNISIFLLLVSQGGLSSQVDADGNNILHLACCGGNVKIVEYILLNKVDINCKGHRGRTPLMAAAYKGHGELFDLLVEKGADLTVVDDARDNILHVACLGEHANIVRCVLKLATVNIDSRGHDNRTPLMMAARSGEKEIFDLLVKKGADITPVDDDGNTILHLASKGGNLDIVKYVLSLKNVDINARNTRDETAAMRATKGSDVRVLLLRHGGIIA